MRVALDGDGSVDAALRAVLNELARARARQTYARSLVARTPELRGRDIRLPVGSCNGTNRRTPRTTT